MELLFYFWDLLGRGHREWAISDLIFGRSLTSLDLQELITLEISFPVLVGRCGDIGHDFAVLFISRVWNLNFKLVGLSDDSWKLELLDLVFWRRETLTNQGKVNRLGVLYVTLDLLEFDFLVCVLGYNCGVEGHIKGELFMRRNETFSWRNIEVIFTEVKVPLESSWDITNVWDHKLLGQLGVLCHRTEVDLVLDIFQINSMAWTGNRTQFSDFLIIDNLVAEWNAKLMLTFTWLITDFNLLSLSGIYGELFLRNVGEIAFLKFFFLGK